MASVDHPLSDPALVGLNPAQRAAVLHDGGPLVVFAGAGSGKTRVITHRVARLVQDHGVAPWNILAVTFTNKAAQEMRERLGRLLGAGVARELWVGTFHATCARLLRRYSEQVGVPRDFAIYDQSDSVALVKRVIKDLGLPDKRFVPKVVAGRIATEKQEVHGPEAMDLAPHEEDLRRIYATYETRMQSFGALDFGDLLYRLVVALEADESLRTELQHRFRHVLVDEFQDTNRVQYRIVRALAASHRNVTVVGDDDQSIYGWRGADRRNILDFRHEFTDASVIKLEQNYRSTARILRAANAVITKALDREPKELWTENEEGAQITVVGCDDERHEARLIVEAVRELRAVGRGLDEIALFYRIHAQSRVFEEELRRNNIAYRIVGGMRFYDRAEVKDLLAYLRVLTRPEDDVSLLRIVNTPPRGIGDKSLDKALDRATRAGTGLYRALAEEARGDGATARRFAAFVTLIEDLRVRLAAGDKLAAVAYSAFEQSGYADWLKSQDTPEADARMQNINELLVAIQLAQEEEPELDLTTFLERVTLDVDDGKGGDGEEKLTLMTVHAAKGLEFPVVVVAGLEDDTFPFRRRDEEDVDEIEEERRLAYVALTRAEQTLMLTWARARRIFNEFRPMRASRFLFELPRDDVRFVGHKPGGMERREPMAAFRRATPSSGPSRRTPEVAPGDSYVDTSEDGELDTQLRVGMRVKHRKFGIGKIVAVTPSVPPRVAVRFEGNDVKTIQADYLEPA